MSVLLKKTVGEIAASRPGATRLFDILGIDYSCHGNLSLHDACAAAGLESLQIRRSLEQLPRDSGEVNWLEQPLAALTRHLRDERQPAIDRAVFAATVALSGDCSQCREHAGRTARLQLVFSALIAVLTPHVSRERQVLFPLVEHLEACWTSGETPSMRLAGGLGPAIHSFTIDHGLLIVRIDQIRRVVDEIEESVDPCHDLVDAMRFLDHEMRAHVHLQNNILFPRAMTLQTVVSTTSDHVMVGGTTR